MITMTSDDLKALLFNTSASTKENDDLLIEAFENAAKTQQLKIEDLIQERVIYLDRITELELDLAALKKSPHIRMLKGFPNKEDCTILGNIIKAASILDKVEVCNLVQKLFGYDTIEEAEALVRSSW